jgi:hypothetical protein
VLKRPQHVRAAVRVLVLADAAASPVHEVVLAEVAEGEFAVGLAGLCLQTGGAQVPVPDPLGLVLGVDRVLGGGLAVVAAGEVVDLAVVAEQRVGAEAGGAEPDVLLEVAVVAAGLEGDDDAADAGRAGGVVDRVEEVFEVAAGLGAVAAGGDADVFEFFEDAPGVVAAEGAAVVSWASTDWPSPVASSELRP